MRRTTLLTVLTISLLSLAACGRSDDQPKVQQNDSGGVTVTDGKGTQVTVNGEGGGSAAMPAFAPLYPGASVESTVTTPGKGGMVMFKTSASQADVISFYQKAAGSAGMKDTLSMKSGETMTYSASSDNPAHSLSVTASPAEGATQVQIVWN